MLGKNCIAFMVLNDFCLPCYFYLIIKHTHMIVRDNQSAKLFFTWEDNLFFTQNKRTTDKSNDGVRLGLGLSAKLAISACFNILYVYTTEIFPTTLRSVSIGCCSTIGRIGAIIAPFVTLLVSWTFSLEGFIKIKKDSLRCI